MIFDIHHIYFRCEPNEATYPLRVSQIYYETGKPID